MDFQKFKEIYQKVNVAELSTSNSVKPLVSICIQTFQHEKYVKECLNSVLNQKTSFPFEILLGEDNSRDNTRNICLEYYKRFPEKIRLFLHHRENQIKIMDEPTSNFNAFYNFFSCTGKYIAFCEGDDIWSDPQKLEKQVRFLEENPDYVFTYHSYISIDKSGNRFKTPEEKYQPKKDLTHEDLLQLNYHPLLLTTCFRNVLTRIPNEMAEVINVDSFLFSLLGEFGKAKYLEHIKPSKYRKHTGGIWSERKIQKKFQSKIITFQKLIKFYQRNNKPQIAAVFQKKLNGSVKMLIIRYIKTGKYYSAFNSYINFIRKSYFSITL